MSSPDVYEVLLKVARPSIIEHSAAQFPEEAVGIITSRGTIYPLINQKRSPHRFLVSRTFIEEAMEIISARGQKSVAFYHSHPTTPADPSPGDITHMQTYPTTIFVIHGIDRIGAFVCLTADEPPTELASVPIEVPTHV